MANLQPTPEENPLLAQLRKDIAAKNFSLPPLPESVQKMQKALQDPKIDAQQIAKLLAIDPVLSGRLIQAANSPLFRGLTQINDIRTAVTRLGMTCIRNLVMSLTLSRLYDNMSKTWIRTKLREIWDKSTKIAAISEVLSRPHRNLDSSEALLAGLIHDIGSVPLVQLCGKRFGNPKNPRILDDAIDALSPQLSHWIIGNWNVRPEIAQVPLETTHLERTHEGPPDYSDIVLVAKLHILRGKDHPLSKANWASVPAFQKLGLSPEDSITAIKAAHSEIQAVMAILKV